MTDNRKAKDRKILWVRFPEGHAKLCIMTLPDRGPGLLLLHDNSDAGKKVMENAEKMGFRVARMKSGGHASVFMRRSDGYPFGTRELAHRLGGVATPVFESVIRKEAYPRPSVKPVPVEERKRAEPVVLKNPNGEEKGVPEKSKSTDPRTAMEIAAFLSRIDLPLDRRQEITPETEQSMNEPSFEIN